MEQPAEITAERDYQQTYAECLDQYFVVTDMVASKGRSRLTYVAHLSIHFYLEAHSGAKTN